jgi:hypothetical protein
MLMMGGFDLPLVLGVRYLGVAPTAVASRKRKTADSSILDSKVGQSVNTIPKACCGLRIPSVGYICPIFCYTLSETLIHNDSACV